MLGRSIQKLRLEARYFSKFRVNICSNEWVAFTGAQRRNRPQQTPIKTKPLARMIVSPKDCPFCPGNDDNLTDVLLKFDAKDFNAAESHSLRVVRNKYPVVIPTPEDAESFLHCGYRDSEPVDIIKNAGLRGQYSFDAFGLHEVVIEHEKHELSLDEMSGTYWEMLFRAFRDRGREMSKDPNIMSIQCFKNVGPFGGASMFHPHSQIVALPVVPSQQFKSHKTAHRFYTNKERCLFCFYSQFEIANTVRVVERTKDFLVVVPFAAHIPYHLMVIPLKHNHRFELEEDETITKLGRLLRRVFKRLDIKLGDPDFNLVLRNSHLHGEQSHAGIPINDFYHWHLEIFPRLDSWPVAGFEFGTGILCNSHLPEDDAKELRNVVLDSNEDLPEDDLYVEPEDEVDPYAEMARVNAVCDDMEHAMFLNHHHHIESEKNQKSPSFPFFSDRKTDLY